MCDFGQYIFADNSKFSGFFCGIEDVFLFISGEVALQALWVADGEEHRLLIRVLCCW